MVKAVGKSGLNRQLCPEDVYIGDVNHTQPMRRRDLRRLQAAASATLCHDFHSVSTVTPCVTGRLII